MNRKRTKNLKNKKQMARSVIQKFVLVLAAFVMLPATAYAGAFLYKNGNAVTFTPSVSNVSNEHITDTWKEWDGTDDEPGVYFNVSKYTGFYLGTFTGNDGQKDKLLPIIQYFLDDTTIKETDMDWVKVDSSDLSGTLDGLTLTVNYNSGNQSGTWTVSQSEKINFYSVKAGNDFALYYVEDGANTGTWTTGHLGEDKNNPLEISHLSIARVPIDPPGENPIPEPTTMLLFGFSLIGLAGVARRRNGKF